MACVRDTSTTRPSIPGTESSGTGLFDSFLAENLYNIMTSPLVSPFLPASSLRSSGSQPIEDREDRETTIHFSDAPTTSTALMLPNVFFDGSEEPVQDRKKSPIAKSYASSHSSPTSTSFMQPGLYSNGPKEPVQDRKISLDAVSSTVSPPTSIDVVSSQSPPSSTALMLPKPHSNGSEKSFEDRRPFVDVVTPVSFHSSPTPIAIMPPRSYPQESEEPVEDCRISTIDTVSTAHSLSPSTGLLQGSIHHNGPGLVQYREIPRDAVPPGFSHSQSSSNGYIHTPLLHSKGLELVPNQNILVDSTSPARPCSPSTKITYRNTPIPHFSRQEPIQDRLVTIDAMPSSTASASPLGGSALQPLSNKTVGVDTFQSLMSSISAPSMDMDMLCSSCRTPVPAIAKCVDCDALFCASCVIAHDLAFNTAAHKIVTFPSAYLSQYQIAISDHDSNKQMDECEEHSLPVRVECHTCNKLFCANCPLEAHMIHDMRYIEPKIIVARHINKELRNKIRKIITEVRRAVEMVKDESIRNDQSRRDTISLVLGELKRYRQDINNQQVEVIQRIDETSQNKDRQLKSQMDNLQSMLKQLYHTEELLSSSSRHSNDMELCTLNERAKMKMREVLVLIPEIITSEGVLTFTGERAIDTLSNIGEFSIERPQTMRPIVGARHPSPGYPRQENPRQGNPRQGNPRQGNPRQGNPRQGNPRQGNSRQGHPRQWNTRNGFSRPGNSGSVISRNVVSRPIIKKEKFEFAFNRAIHGTGPVVVKYSMPPESSFVFGKAGGDEGLLCRPWGVCCDHNGNIIVADRSNNRIQVFDSEGRFKFAFGKFGSEKGEFNKPAGLSVNHEGNIVVCDKDNHRVQMFTPNGTFLRSFGRFGDKTGEFNYPWDLACNKIGHIVVSDTRNHRIQLFSSFGLFLGKFGYEESANNMMKQFECPRGVTFLPDGQIAVTEFNNHRLVIIDSNLEEAKFYGKQGSDTDDFFRPQGIICDDEGNIVVSDSKNHRIKVIYNDGRVSMVGTKGSNLGQVDVPSGICLSPDGRIIVVDFGNSRIQVF